jgi:hypothetical protein
MAAGPSKGRPLTFVPAVKIGQRRHQDLTTALIQTFFFEQLAVLATEFVNKPRNI